MTCPRCGTVNSVGRRFCAECGSSLALACPSCGFSNEPGVKFCGGCGATLAASLVVATPRFAAPETYTPRHLAEKIITSKAALEGERKQITVLFADLKGSMELLADRDPEEARKLLDPVLGHMMEAVHHYEGTVNQVMGDGIMALFGAPLAREDHAVRACYAALRMQEAIGRYGEDARRTHGAEIRIRVGLHSGDVVVRSIGSDLRMDYSAVGQTTHLAARMEQLAAPGSTRLTADTLRLAEGYVAVKALGAVPVKGLAEPIDVYELTGAGPARTRLGAAIRRGLSQFVGRDSEIEQVRHALERARQGHGQVVGVVGEPGIGKSRLVWEFTRAHRAGESLVLESACASYAKATAYLPLIDLFTRYFQLEGHDDAGTVRAKVASKLVTLDHTLSAAVPALLALLDVPSGDPAWHALDARQRRQRTIDAASQVLVRESQVQPIILLFEDLHWLDDESQAVLDRLVEALPTARILLLVTYRREYQHRWSSKTYYTQIRLDPLAPERAEEMLAPLLGSDSSLQRLKRLLIDRTEGNPFFLEECTRTLVETNVLTGERGAYRATRPIDRVEVPATVHAILAARVDRLSPDQKNVLQTAAVIGKDVPLTLLQAVGDLSEEALRSALAALQSGEFLYETSVFPDPEYTFKHALTLEVAYQSLLRERRQALHERVMSMLEAAVTRGRSVTAEVLAHHAVKAESWERAARYLVQSGEKAYALARYRASAHFYRAAIEVLDRLGPTADLTLKLDACLQLWSAQNVFGEFDGLPEVAAKAEQLARTLDDGPRLAQVQVRQAQAIYQVGTIPGTLAAAVDTAREAFGRAAPGDLRTRSYAQYLVACACRDLGDIAEAVRAFDAGIALFEGAERHGAEPGLLFPIYVSLAAWRSEALAAFGEFPRATASARDALRVATDIQHPASLTVASGYLGYVHLLRGELQTAVPLLERALALAIEHDLLQGTLRSASYLAYARVLLGERDRGLACLAQSFERYSATVVPPHVLVYRAVTARAYLAAGVAEKARAEIQWGLAAVREQNARGHLTPLLRLEAEVLAPDDPARARARLEEALALAMELGMRPEAAHCHAGLGRLFRRTGKHEQVSDHLTTATAMYREMGMMYWLEQAEAELRQFA